MKLKQLLAILCLILSVSLYAQPRCGFDAIHNQKLQTDPTYKRNFERESELIREQVQQINLAKIKPLSTTATYVIPVVVHVVHTGGAVGSIYNPTDAQIEGAIDYLNSVYAGTFTDVQGIGDMQIQFALAQRDPNCNPTSGINRVDGSSIPGYASNGIIANVVGAPELNVKNIIRWNPSQYYNIWVVNKIDGADGTSGSFIAGYAYFPGAPSNLDGTVMLATQMRAGDKTLPHEIGHALALHHPFNGSNGNTCAAPETDCSAEGDGVCDTEQITMPSNLTTCRTGTINPCTGSAYTINTENNFMNYTSCYTLFTQGQKTRALAAMSLASRASLANSLGGTAPNEGTTTCIPKINFELAADQKTEVTTSTVDCRNYTDYTYNVVIGNSPTATATATLTLDGTATEKVDYDITTNGNFTTPSKTLTFAAGSVTPQSFRVRVYDDAIVEGYETLTIGLTLNNGGGDAVIGDARPNFTLSLADNDNLPVSGGAPGVASIGTTSGIIGDIFDATLTKQRSQFLYRASELTAAGLAAGNITGLALNIGKYTTRAFTNLSIKIAPTSQNYLVNNGSAFVASGGVVMTTANYTTTAGWNTFTFDAPYTWNGTSNLVVEVCYDNITADAAANYDDVMAYSDGSSSTQGNFLFKTDVNCAEAITGPISYYSNGVKPVIQFHYGVQQTLVQSTVNTSKQEYLGPNADVYFYDQTDKKLLARIRNLSSHDYGCTTVEIDRAGVSAQAFTTNSASQYLLNKTFRVTPTTNNPSGQYEITLYYTDAEKAGWEAAAGQNWDNILLVKVPSQVSNYTPATPTPDGAGAVALVTPVRSTLGTQYALTATFANGFSGFGAGIPATTLPVTLVNFDGKLQNKQANLTWSTSFEQNTRNFDIEKSIDGTQFYTIGSVAAAGNSSFLSTYTFKDDKLAPLNYYRLRMNDLDATSTLSKVLLIKYEETPQKVWIGKTIFSDQIQVLSIKAIQHMELQLVDNKGNIVLQRRVKSSATNYQWTLPKIVSSGFYILRVSADDKLYTFKLIKE